MPNPTTLRKTPEDEAKLEALQQKFPYAPVTAIWRMGLDALMEKHGLKLPSSPRKTKSGPLPAKGAARKGKA